MATLSFRDLRADEIDCRVATVGEKGLSLLLYKDARCDMNILDETVGPMNWQRSHARENANCIVSIWDEDKKQWISKEDTGTESFTEAEKGLASDSFKRACFNWGIGRELYTAPFIWVERGLYNEFPKNGKLSTNDKFVVDSITIKDKKITGLVIKNASKKYAEVYRWGKTTKKTSAPAPTGDIAPTGEPMVSYTVPEQAPVAPAAPAPVETAPAETKQKNPVRVEFLDYVTAHGLDLTSICKTMGINNESTDDDFRRAKQYAESLVNPASLLGNGQIGLDLPQEV